MDKKALAILSVGVFASVSPCYYIGPSSRPLLLPFHLFFYLTVAKSTAPRIQVPAIQVCLSLPLPIPFSSSLTSPPLLLFHSCPFWLITPNQKGPLLPLRASHHLCQRESESQIEENSFIVLQRLIIIGWPSLL